MVKKVTLEKAPGQKRRDCEDCEFFDPRRPGGGLNEDAGICRAFGPTVSHVSTFVAKDSGEMEPTVQIVTHWPKVQPGFDWCVEFEAVPKPRTRKK